jgi:YidC/Oxa1 family membrane protein insertase
MDKRTILAVALIIAVIGVYNMVIIPKFTPPPPPSVSGGAKAPGAQPPPATAPQAAQPEARASLPASSSAPPVPAAPPEKVTVDRDLYTATFSNVGGALESWQLKKYPYGKGQLDSTGATIAGRPLELVRTPPAAVADALTFSFSDAATAAGFATPMAVERTSDGFTLTGADAQGLRVTRTHRFSNDTYTMEILLSIENHGEASRPASWEMSWGPGIDRNLAEKDRTDEGAMTFAAGRMDTVKVKKPGERRDLGPVTWVGMGNRYFLAALLPKEGAMSAFARRRSEAGEDVGVRAEVSALAPHQAVTYRLHVFLGPKERGILSAVGAGLENSVNYGWFSWLAIPFLAVLQFCYRFLHSYGLAIFALTLLVKAALFPVSFKMFRSMKKMQELAPKLQALKNKFKGDNQGLQQATMGLYREHKVNPMAGCLPMFVQIPVFFALYRVLYNAIELRAAGFLYIPDLSQKDPYYITPILMGATMLIQQRMTPTVGDPTQAKMMMFMPIIMTAMFINFSSGLVLYFLFSNILSIGEQRLFRAIGGRGRTGAPPEEPAAGGRRKRLPTV